MPDVFLKYYLLKKTMKKFVIALIVFMIVLNKGYAQQSAVDNNDKGKAIQHIEVAICSQYFFNGSSVKNDGNIPELISARNTWGGLIDINYKRTTKYSLTWEAGLLYGFQSFDATVYYKNLDFFYPPYSIGSIPENNLSVYRANIPYIGAKFAIGYQGILPEAFGKNISWESSLGLQLRMPIRKYYNDNYHPVQFQIDSSIYFSDFGGESGVLGGKAFKVVNLLPQFYVGLKKKIGDKTFRTLSAGILITHGIGNQYGGFAVIDAYTRDHTFKIISEDKYRSRDFSIGLRIAAGLW